MQDIISDLSSTTIANLYLNGSGINEQGASFDSANYEPGVTYYFAKSESNGGQAVVTILESDDDLSFSPVPAESLIGSLDGVADNIYAGGDPMPSVGVFSNKRYIKLRLEVIGGGQDTGDDTVVLCFLVAKREILPNG